MHAANSAGLALQVFMEHEEAEKSRRYAFLQPVTERQHGLAAACGAAAAGLRGKLKKLPSGYVALNVSSPEAGRKVPKFADVSIS
jgi:hypothetical protein